MDNILAGKVCKRCEEPFEPGQEVVSLNQDFYHVQCFVCAQCFRPIKDQQFFTQDSRNYCEHDFNTLFAPKCKKCSKFIVGRVIKALNANWHPECFNCETCSTNLADSGFFTYRQRAYCKNCYAKAKAVDAGKPICALCIKMIDEELLYLEGNAYHGSHFKCANCNVELDHLARELPDQKTPNVSQKKLYCPKCHNKLCTSVCGACRHPIEGRAVIALGKHWHVEHFVCAKCNKPFNGHPHFEKRGLAYCETHYQQLFGSVCFVCNKNPQDKYFTAFNDKVWCVNHFSCTFCDKLLDTKAKFFEYDEKPMCEKCQTKIPRELGKRLADAHKKYGKGKTIEGVSIHSAQQNIA